MTLDEVYKHFGSWYRVAKSGFSDGTSAYWRKIGYIPIYSQLKIERITGKVLRASLEDCEKKIG
jgi:hypothetical protein